MYESLRCDVSDDDECRGCWSVNKEMFNNYNNNAFYFQAPFKSLTVTIHQEVATVALTIDDK